MKKIAIFLLTIFTTIGLSLGIQVEAKEADDSYTIQQVIYSEIISDQDGNIVSKTNVEKGYFESQVEEQNMLRDKYLDLLSATNDINYSMDSIYVIDDLTSTSGSSNEIYCSVYSSSCTATDVYTASYTIHTTTVKVYPTRVAPTYTSIVVDDVLEWVITPIYRMSDLMSVSWDGDHFSEKFSTIYASMYAKYTYKDVSGFFCQYSSSSLKTTATSTFTPSANSSKFKLEDNGVIFQPDISVYKDVDPVDPWAWCYDSITYSYIYIKMHVELIIDSPSSIYASTLTNTSLKTEYIHFWEELTVNLSLNAGVSITGPTAGITLTPSITTKHDDPRTNYIYFYFTR